MRRQRGGSRTHPRRQRRQGHSGGSVEPSARESKFNELSTVFTRSVDALCCIALDSPSTYFRLVLAAFSISSASSFVAGRTSLGGRPYLSS